MVSNRSSKGSGLGSRCKLFLILVVVVVKGEEGKVGGEVERGEGARVYYGAK